MEWTVPTTSRPGYATDLSDAQWALLQPLLYPPDAKRGRGAWRTPHSAPSAAIIDSQSVKGGQLPAGSSGYDAGKKTKGRKRHTLRDTNGLLLGVVVTPASVQDRDGAKVLLCLFCHALPGLLMVFADGAYAGKLEEFVAQMGGLLGLGASFALGIVKKARPAEGLHHAAAPLGH